MIAAAFMALTSVCLWGVAGYTITKGLPMGPLAVIVALLYTWLTVSLIVDQVKQSPRQ